MQVEAAQHLKTTRKHDKGETPVVYWLTKKAHLAISPCLYLFNAMQFSEDARPVYHQFFKDKIRSLMNFFV